MTTLDTLRIRCETSLKESLAKLARRQQRTMSNLALHVLTEYVRLHTEEPDTPPLTPKTDAINPEQLQAEMKAAVIAMRETKPPCTVSYFTTPQEAALLNDRPLPKPTTKPSK